MRATARAHPNIALVKYWGKAPGPGNVPAVPSLSITLDTLTTTTTVAESAADGIRLNGAPTDDPKITAWLEALRREHDVPPLAIDTRNDFPTAAGLASSASGFAALATAIDAALGLGLSRERLAALARQGSASAARSLFGGFAALRGPDWQGEAVLDPEAWPLAVVIAVTDAAAKAVGSTEGMRRSAATSPYYPAWVESAGSDFDAALAAVAARDFTALAEVTEHSTLKMHGLMLATRPGLVYWNATTVACLQQVRELRRDGAAVCFTMDAGPQVKAVCLPECRADVAAALGAVPGVREVLVTGLGPGAAVVPAAVPA